MFYVSDFCYVCLFTISSSFSIWISSKSSDQSATFKNGFKQTCLLGLVDTDHTVHVRQWFGMARRGRNQRRDDPHLITGFPEKFLHQIGIFKFFELIDHLVFDRELQYLSLYRPTRPDHLAQTDYASHSKLRLCQLIQEQIN